MQELGSRWGKLRGAGGALTPEVGMRPWQGKFWNLSGPAKLKGTSSRTSPWLFLLQGPRLHRTQLLCFLHTQPQVLPLCSQRSVCTVPSTPCSYPLHWALCAWALTFTMSLKGGTLLYLLRQHRAQGHGRAGIHALPSQHLAEGWTRPSRLIQHRAGLMW